MIVSLEVFVASIFIFLVNNEVVGCPVIVSLEVFVGSSRVFGIIAFADVTKCITNSK